MSDLKMFERPGYTGKLNGKILERVQFLSKELNLPNLEASFPHLKVTDGSWRKPALPADVDLGQFIDHTQLKAAATRADIEQLCKEATDNKFKAVCVNGCRVALCKELLAGSGVEVACVCGFPLGQMTSAMKAAEATEEIALGAHDVDMVINVGQMKDKNYKFIYEDIKAVCDACGPNVVSKVIFETCLLTDEEIIDCAIMSIAAGANFVKTSTGFSTSGSTPEVVDIMLAVVGNQALVKASGGVRDRSTAQQYVLAGVRRIGTSSGIAIVQGGQSQSKY